MELVVFNFALGEDKVASQLVAEYEKLCVSPKNVKTRWKWHSAQLVGCFKEVEQTQSNCIISSSGGKHQKNNKHYLKRQPSEDSLLVGGFNPSEKY